MKLYKRVSSLTLSLLLVFSLLNSTFAIQSYAATSPALSAESKSVSAGEQFTVAVNLSNATAVYGGNFTLQYDSNLLTADSYTFGSIVGSHTKNCNLDYQSAGNLIRFTFSGASALTSSGTLVTFTFTAKQSVSGSATLQFTAYKMYDANGSAIISTANGATISISPKPVVSPSISITNKTVTVGETVSVPVMISNSSDVYGGNFTLQYDSSLLTAESYSFGSIVSGHTKNCNLDYQSVGNLIRVTFSGASAVSSDGTLVTFTFTAKAEGTAALEFAAYKMYDENGVSRSLTATNGSITVNEKSSSNIVTGKCGDNAYYELCLDTGFLHITGEGNIYDSAESEVPWYDHRTVIKEIIIDFGITAIGENAFVGCSDLKTIEIPNSIESIGWRAFQWCSSLVSVKIPNSVVNIGASAFADSGLTSVMLPDGITSINKCTFAECYDLVEIMIPSNVTNIDDCAFSGCHSLTSITIPESVTYVGFHAFDVCSSLKKIEILNADCRINTIGIYGSTVIYGYRGSTADDYANQYGLEFIPIDAAELISVSTASQPSKKIYYIGDSLDTSGLQLELTYSDGSTEIVTSGYTLSGFSSATAGTKTVTVTYEGLTTTFTVIVNTPSVSLSFTSKSMTVGDTATLTATTTPSGQTVTWTSSDTSVATVSSGTITAKAAGSATITAKFTYNGITYSKTCSVTVSNPVVTISSISVHTNPTKTTYYIGDALNTAGLQLKLTYSDGSTETVTSGFTTSGFSSTSAGTKKVTVSYDGKTTTFTVMVNTPSVSLSSTSKEMNVGGTATLTAATTPSGQTVTWSSSNTSIATVSGGTIVAKSAGIARIAAKFTYNGITYTEYCDVTVTEAAKTLSSIAVSSKPTKTVYNIGETLDTSGMVLRLTYSNGSTETVSSGFTTSGFSSATAGTKTVTVSYGGKTTSFTVTVNATAVDGPRVIVENKKARVGSTVLITVSLEENPGIWGMDLVVNYDKTQLTLTSVTNGTVFSESEWTQGNLSGDKYILSYEASGFNDITTNGVLATLEFTINENATVDSFSDISLLYNVGDIINVNFDDIDVAVVSGGVNISNFVYGDLNGDGLVNKKDSLLMKMYLADNSTIIDKQAADVYVDGNINKKDSLYLKQYLAGLDVELGA